MALILSLRTEKDTDEMHLLSCSSSDKFGNRQLGVNRTWLNFECHFLFRVNRMLRPILSHDSQCQTVTESDAHAARYRDFIIKRLRYQLHVWAIACTRLYAHVTMWKDPAIFPFSIVTVDYKHIVAKLYRMLCINICLLKLYKNINIYLIFHENIYYKYLIFYKNIYYKYLIFYENIYYKYIFNFLRKNSIKIIAKEFWRDRNRGLSILDWILVSINMHSAHFSRHFFDTSADSISMRGEESRS